MAATATKTAPKKPVTKKKAAPKKSAARKTSAKIAELQSFRVMPLTKTNFFTFHPSIQTIYWLTLSALVLALGIWVVQLSVKVQNIYDQIDQTTQSTNLMTTKKTIKH